MATSALRFKDIGLGGGVIVTVLHDGANYLAPNGQLQFFMGLAMTFHGVEVQKRHEAAREFAAEHGFNIAGGSPISLEEVGGQILTLQLWEEKVFLLAQDYPFDAIRQLTESLLHDHQISVGLAIFGRQISFVRIPRQIIRTKELSQVSVVLQLVDDETSFVDIKGQMVRQNVLAAVFTGFTAKLAAEEFAKRNRYAVEGIEDVD